MQKIPYIYGLMIILIIIAGIVGYFAGTSVAPGRPVTITVPTTITTTVTVIQTVVPTPVPTPPPAKFRAIPYDWVKTLWENYMKTAPWTPKGPNGEKPSILPNLTAEEIEKAKKLQWKDVYYFVATPDPTELLNMIGMNDVLKQFGVEVKHLDAWSISEQIGQIEGMIPKADTLSFVAMEAYEAVSVGPSCVRLADAGVPQVAVWTTPEGMFNHPNYIGLVDADGYAQGALSAEMLAYMLNYQGNILIVKFGLLQWTNVMRYQGAIDTFKKYPGIKIVAEVAFTDVTQVRDLVLAALQAHPEVNGIWATWMIGPATGAAEAVIALGRQKDIVITAPDLGGLEGARAIADPNNPIKGAAEADLITMGRYMVIAGIKWLLGDRSIHNGYWVAPVYPITRSNLKEMWYITGNNRYFGDLPQDIIALLEKPWP
jgi:ribose transport system substrate-binding protein